MITIQDIKLSIMNEADKIRTRNKMAFPFWFTIRQEDSKNNKIIDIQGFVRGIMRE